MAGVQRHAREAIAGACFGSALFASGVYHPSVITSQLRFESYHMLQVMLGASAASAAVFYLAGYFQVADIKKKASSDLDLFAYDGNILGGTLLGAGMALSGACPGTVVVQIAAGIHSGLWVALGGLLGAAAFLAIKPSLPTSAKSSAPTTPTNSNFARTDAGPSTIPEALHTSERTVFYGWETICAIGFYITKFQVYSSPTKAAVLVDSLWGGPLIGLGQTASVCLNGHSVGVSGVYEGVAEAVIEMLRWAGQLKRWQSGPRLELTPSMSFAAGIFSAAYLLSASNLVTSSATKTFAASPAVAPAVAIVAGAAMVFGARLSGGCTSGHAISGLATFSISSLVTTAAMFGSGALTAFTMG